ncbi:MAG: tRNA uridine-5-carboxymethylaminomethyl(34) synthesis enzyme MnmG [Candidatus Omnitrophota bacterium]|nr:tRNA uridine-5-carboxymethylaminomethyl(34) synthesis enzyme MnmG [Candidatus Omnitrophota bacterium]
MRHYDVIVIGAGHAGIEASSACARMGQRVLMVTLNKNNIGAMSCNPAIGGVGKGQLVKEIDALGGVMARAADACAMQFRILNASKGAAVQSSRAQIDMDMYRRYMQRLLAAQKNPLVKEAEVKKIIVEDNTTKGIITAAGEEINAGAVVVCAGTFLNGLIHVGLKNFSGGRINEPASSSLAQDLKDMGFKTLRFKTGTCPRLDRETIDFSGLVIQEGDNPPGTFSFFTKKLTNKQVPCYITYTDKDTHKIILDNLDRSPLYAGIISATGVRYCPSIEDKVVKFSDRERHQVFLEPQGYKTKEIYPNGLSTSLPEEVQLKILHSIKGLEKARVIRFGYGIEHEVIEPTQLNPTLETKSIRNLYLAGQVNGTTGYEEAAAQGLVAGINAALGLKQREPFVLDRSTSYIGVLIDDLTTKGTLEPYRMFTSRVEYRLILREDNADLRLGKIGYCLGLLSRKDYQKISAKSEALKKGIVFLRMSRLKPGPIADKELLRMGSTPIKKAVTLEELLKRPEIHLEDLRKLRHLKLDVPACAFRQIETEIKYSDFIQRQKKQVEGFKNLENIRLPPELDYSGISGLSREIKEKLTALRPLNLGQASRISGVTPAAVSIVMVYLRNLYAQR